MGGSNCRQLTCSRYVGGHSRVKIASGCTTGKQLERRPHPRRLQTNNIILQKESTGYVGALLFLALRIRLHGGSMQIFAETLPGRTTAPA